jgi:hypothetical protein
MRNGQFHSTTMRRRVAVAVSTLAVLSGVAGLESGASASRPHSNTSHNIRTTWETRWSFPLRWRGSAPKATAPSAPVTTTTPPATTPPPVVTTPPPNKTPTTTPTKTPTTTPPAKIVTTPPPTTTPPVASTSGTVPDAPASLGAPTKVVLDDEFSTGALNTALWAPEWFTNGSSQNGTTMETSNVSVGANGLALNLAANGTGGIVSSNPSDGVSGHSGFQIAPTAGNPVYVEYKVTVPAAPDGKIANWPALWLDGQSWPEDGEIDVMEGLAGEAAYHIHYGSGSGTAQGGNVNTSPGTHTYGVLWSTTGVTFVYDGAVVGSLTESMTSPMYLIMENSVDASTSVVSGVTDVRYVRVFQQ